MEGDEVYRAVLAFLDQFIERGAAPDVRTLRSRLIDDPDARQALVDQLPGLELTEREAFDAMRAFISVELKRRGEQQFDGGSAPNLVLLLSWTSWEDWGGRDTSDPAQWHDWLGAVEVARAAGD